MFILPKKNFLLFLTYLLCVNSFAQKSKMIDSLLLVISKKQNDTTLVNNYSLLAEEYQKFDLKKAIEINEKVWVISKKINYQKGFANFYSTLSRNFQINGEYENAIKTIDKAIPIYLKLNDEKNYLYSVYVKSFNLLMQNKIYAAIKTAKKGLIFAEKVNNFGYMARLNYTLGICYNEQNNLEKAIFYLNKAIFYYKKAKDYNNINSCYNEFARIYNKTNQLNKAIFYTQKAIFLDKKYNYGIGSRDLLSNIAGYYLRLKDYKKALKYARLALTKGYESKNWDVIAFNTNTIAKIYYQLGRFELAIFNAKKALKINSNVERNIVANQILGNCFFAKKKYAKALYYQEKALKAIQKYKEKDISDNSNIYEEIAETENVLGNFKNAYRYSVLSKEISIKLLNEEKTNRINELQTKFEVSDKENALKSSILKNQNQKIKIQNQKSYIYFGLLLLIILSLFFAWIFKIKNLKNRALQQQKMIVEKANLEILQSQDLLKKNLDEKELLLREIHHRVKNNLQLVISLLNIQAMQEEGSNIEVFLEKSLSRITSMSLIHQNLYQNDHIGKVNFNEYLANLIESVLSTFSNHNQRIKVDIKVNNIFFEIENAIPLGLIVNELLYNAFKHAFPNEMKGKITITILVLSKGYSLIFKDNGVGFAESFFEKDTLGIKLVKLLSQQLNGKLIIDGLKGTTFKINFTGKKGTTI